MTFLTGFTHGRPDRQPRHLVATVDERVSLEAVVNAITDIMGDYNRFGIVDRALASRIGRDVQTAVAGAIGSGRITSSAQLTSQQAFWGILAQHLATTSSAFTDQQARQSLLHYIRTQANRTGADFATFVAQFRRGGGYADRGSDRDGGSALLTSARFDAFSGTIEAQRAVMRSFALEQGLHWAADRPEILDLGRDAIRLLARTGFTRQSHDRLHEAGFDHHDMVRIARYAESRGLNVNDVARETAEAVDGLSGGDAEARQGWIRRFRRLYENPQDEEARRDMERSLNEVEARPENTPGQREGAERARRLLRLERQATSEAQAETAAEKAAREAREEAERLRAVESARLEADRRRLAALEAGDDPPGDGPPAPGPQQVPAAGAGQHQRAEAAPPRLTTVAPT